MNLTESTISLSCSFHTGYIHQVVPKNDLTFSAKFTALITLVRSYEGYLPSCNVYQTAIKSWVDLRLQISSRTARERYRRMRLKLPKNGQTGFSRSTFFPLVYGLALIISIIRRNLTIEFGTWGSA